MKFQKRPIYSIVSTWNHLHNPLLHQPYWDMYYATIIEEKYSSKENYSFSKLMDFRGLDSEKIDIEIEKLKPNGIFIYWVFKTPDAIETEEIVEKIRKKFNNTVHIAGGTHIEKTPIESQKIYDSIIIGPGEELFIKAIEDIKNNNLRERYEQPWSEVHFKDTTFARRDFIPKDRMISYDLFKEYGKLPATLTYFSRGCIYKCAFCTLNVPNMLQMKNPDLVYDEITYLKKEFGIEAILLKDEIAIHPSRKISNPFLEAIKSAGIIWRGQTVTKNTLEQLQLAKESGCTELAVGVETVNETTMKNIGKQWQNLEQIETFIKNAHTAGIRIKICLILGLPGEGNDIVEKTISFLEKNKVEYANVSGLCPLPGSPMYEDKEKYGIEWVDETWSKHVHLVYRFSDDEQGQGLPFRYDQKNPLNEGRTPEIIQNDIIRLQTYLRETGRSY